MQTIRVGDLTWRKRKQSIKQSNKQTNKQTNAELLTIIWWSVENGQSGWGEVLRCEHRFQIERILNTVYVVRDEIAVYDDVDLHARMCVRKCESVCTRVHACFCGMYQKGRRKMTWISHSYVNFTWEHFNAVNAILRCNYELTIFHR